LVVAEGAMKRPKFLDSKALRARADECRALAETLRTPELRDRMLKVVAEYEQLALAAAQRELPKPGTGSPKGKTAR
jgi:hypothetical protein